MELELPDPDVLLTRLEALNGDYASVRGDMRSLAGDRMGGRTEPAQARRMAIEDGAGNWFAVIRLPDDRAVLFGWDESAARWSPDDDPWEGAPAWAIAADRNFGNPRINSATVAFVRWWDDGRWRQSEDDQPGEDGLYMATRFVSNPWFPAGKPEMERSIALARAGAFEPDEPDLRIGEYA
ncbi:hypothetical protein AB0L82_13700 [Nocardia sp. NPDC052001]|uniref:hypothetical protein n=1 Tax=Nocardia sp. NPDC052001 TaxID=3154853 RepID=UPI0034265279